MSHSWPWAALLVLGAVHGINPGMGWLFAVARGLQEGRSSAVWSTLPPLALGHAVAIGVMLAAAAVVGLVVPGDALRWCVAVVLLVFGLYRLLRARHPRYGGMQVGFRDLTIWSFLMATAHGAGLMVLPLVMNGGAAALWAADAAPRALHAAHTTSAVGGELSGLLAALVHTVGYLLVTGAVAAIVYRKLGLRLLRTAWINLDVIWAGTLIVTAIATPLLS